MQANMEFRTVAKKAGVRLWEVAEAIGITDGMLSRRLHRELPKSEFVTATISWFAPTEGLIPLSPSTSPRQSICLRSIASTGT